MRTIQVQNQALEDLQFWSLNDVKLLRKTFDLLASTIKEPFQGLGKPEALKGDLRGYWSRRINEEHRIIYSVTNELIIVISCRSHYKKK